MSPSSNGNQNHSGDHSAQRQVTNAECHNISVFDDHNTQQSASNAERRDMSTSNAQCQASNAQRRDIYVSNNHNAQRQVSNTERQYIPITDERQLEINLDFPFVQVSQPREEANRVITQSMKGITKPK